MLRVSYFRFCYLLQDVTCLCVCIWPARVFRPLVLNINTKYMLCIYNVRLVRSSPAGERGPVREGVALAGEPTGDGEGPRMPDMWGEVCGENGDWAGLLWSPWLLETPDVLTPGLSAPSAPVGRSSMEPRSWEGERDNTKWWLKTNPTDQDFKESRQIWIPSIKMK